MMKDFKWNLLANVPASIIGIFCNLTCIITLGYYYPSWDLKWYTKVIDKTNLFK